MYSSILSSFRKRTSHLFPSSHFRFRFVMLVMYVSTEMRFLAGLILTLIALVTYFLWPCFDHLSSELLLWISRCRDCLINHISSSCGSIFLFLSIFHLFAKVFFLQTTQETTVLGVGFFKIFFVEYIFKWPACLTFLQCAVTNVFSSVLLDWM